jgi:ATP-dependent Clp protease ATP-binding subunit ClpC
MTDPSDGSGPASWEDLIARLTGTPESRRPVYRVDIGRLMSAEARDLFVDAARRATALGARDIDTSHLLWAALQREGLRSLVHRVGADPDALLSQLERKAAGRPGSGSQASVPPAGGLTLTPATKRALLQAHQI